MSKRLYRVTLTIDVPVEGSTEDSLAEDFTGNLMLRMGVSCGSLSNHKSAVVIALRDADQVGWHSKKVQLTIPNKPGPELIGEFRVERLNDSNHDH